MARFFGRYEHSLDAKGRVILPAKFRSAFGNGGYLSQFNEKCLALWTPEDFEKQMAAMEQSQTQGRDERNLARYWSSGVQEVEVDKQGRMAVPALLRKYAALESEVLVIGAIDRVELWDPAEWNARVAPTEARLTDDQTDLIDQTHLTDQTETTSTKTKQNTHSKAKER